MVRKRRRGGKRPLWGATPVDVNIGQVRPLPGWVLLKEVFTNTEHQVEGTDVTLSIHRPRESNTVFGEVLAIHPDTAKSVGVDTGDEIVFREYSGGRWSFNGVKTLLTPSRDILAKVAAESRHR